MRVFVSNDNRSRAEKWNRKGSTLFLLMFLFQVRVIFIGVLCFEVVGVSLYIS